MKTFLIIGATLAASQCLSEPSGGPAPKRPAATSGGTNSAPPNEADTGVPAEPDAGSPDGGAVAAGAWLQIGPAPFGVPTVRIPLGDHPGTILVPASARAQSTTGGLRIIVGEGKNFSMLVGTSEAELADVRQMLTNELDDREPREDGAMVWNDGERWFFQLPGEFVCWNDDTKRHDAGDIEVMIASCLSIETQ